MREQKSIEIILKDHEDVAKGYRKIIVKKSMEINRLKKGNVNL